MISPVNLKKNEMEDLSSDRIVRKWFQVKKAINFKISITYMYYFQSLIHCRMRRQSLCLVMATNQNSGIDVFFGAEFNFRVQIPDFRRAHHYKVSKNLLLGCQHQKGLFTRTGLKVLRVSVKWTIRDVLKACVTTILRLFTCRTREHELA